MDQIWDKDYKHLVVFCGKGKEKSQSFYTGKPSGDDFL